MSQLSEDLKALNVELQNSWCKGKLTERTEDGDKHCLVGAMRVVTGSTGISHNPHNSPVDRQNPRMMALTVALEAHLDAVWPKGYRAGEPVPLWMWNDRHATSADDVRDLVGKALAEEGHW